MPIDGVLLGRSAPAACVAGLFTMFYESYYGVGFKSVDSKNHIPRYIVSSVKSYKPKYKKKNIDMGH